MQLLDFAIVDGLAPNQRRLAAQLFWQAFRGKLERVMRPEDKALNFHDFVIDPSHAISAIDSAGNLVGLAGDKTEHGAFIGADFRDVVAAYGVVGGVWRALSCRSLSGHWNPVLS